MSPNYAAQLDALKELSLAYQSARDFTLPVLRKAFGDPPPPPSKCVWPPPGITKWEASSGLQSVQAFLHECGVGLIQNTVREIKAAQVAVEASGLNMPTSWIIADPLEAFRMGGSSVTEIVESAPAEDAALEKVIGRIEVALVKLKGKAARSTSPAAKPGQGEGNGAAVGRQNLPQPVIIVNDYRDNSLNIQGNVQGSNLAAGGSTVAGSSTSYTNNRELVEALKALTPLIRSGIRCQEDEVKSAIAILVLAAGDPSVTATEVERAASVVVNSSPTLKQQLGDIAGRIGVSLAGSAIFQGIKMALGIP